MSRRERHRRRGRSNGSAGRVIFLGLGVVLGAAALAVLGTIGWIVGIAASAPSIATLTPIPQGATSTVYAADGSKLGYVQSTILRTNILSRDIPQSMKDATVAIEDKRFFEHRGVDAEGIVRAALKNIENRGNVQGGSTLTMQLVKNLYEKETLRSGKERTLKVKIQEAKLAEDLENEHPGVEGKNWILTKYINNVPYGTVGGQTAVGVHAAARVFFDKPAVRLTLAESALLAGLPQAPSQYSPFRNRDAARERRNQVLQVMLDEAMITPAEFKEADRARLGLRENTYYNERREGYFFDYVQSELVDRYGYETVRKGGLRIYTTLDLDKQQAAKVALQNGIAGTNRDSALVTMEHDTGYIRAMASSRSYGDLKFNLAAQGKRQPGSTFKVMTLMTALRRGVDPDTTSYTSMPLNFNDPEWGQIEVSTYGETYNGRMNLHSATLQSDNTVYMQLALDVGPGEVRKTAYDMGITTKLEGFPAESLGGLKLGVSPLEMSRAYSTIANGGDRVRPIAVTKVTFPDGHTETPFKQKKVKVFTDGQAYEATKILQDNIIGGTGGLASIGCPAAGKTGTTDEFTDAWFVGYTPKLSTAVWVGHADSRDPMPGAAGGVVAAPIWGAYMNAIKGKECGDFPQPKEAFVAQPFFGKYSTTGVQGNNYSSDDNYSTPPTYTPDPGAQDGQDTGNGANAYDPDLYESPPQETPAAPQPQTPAPSGGGTQAPGGDGR
ncbi:MAG: transglycosylase domain-containing protein [Solirubrobacteraceae bacterium]